jgi:hypothetical protein
MADVTITLPDVSAQDLAVLSNWLDNARNELEPVYSEKKIVERLQKAVDLAEAKQYAAERIEV